MMTTPDSPKTINLTNAAADYMLGVGEKAVIEYVDLSSVPLHVATSTKGIYRLMIFNDRLTFRPTSGYIILNPNNTAYPGEIYRLTIEYRSDFYLGSTCPVNFEALISTRTGSKSLKSNAIVTQSQSFYYEENLSTWENSTTEWTSLGTITFPQVFSGCVIVERIA